MAFGIIGYSLNKIINIKHSYYPRSKSSRCSETHSMLFACFILSNVILRTDESNFVLVMYDLINYVIYLQIERIRYHGRSIFWLIHVVLKLCHLSENR